MGEIELLREEIGDYRWWDGETELTIIPSAMEIIGRARDGGHFYNVSSRTISLNAMLSEILLPG